MNDIKLIIFDLDGTLVDSERVYHEGWKKALLEMGYHITDAQLSSMTGQTTQFNNKLIKSIVLRNDILKEVRSKRDEYFIKQLRTGNVPLMTNAKKFIEILYGKYSIGVATQSPKKRGSLILKKLGLHDYIDFAIYGDQVQNGKPDPELYIKVLDRLEIESTKAIAIEDSIIGVTSSLNANINTIYVSYKDLSSNKLREHSKYIGHFKNLAQTEEWFYQNEII